MTQKQLIELVQQHHPQMNAQEIIKMINRAQDEYTTRTRILESSKEITVVADQRRYSLSVDGDKDEIMEIKDVDLNGETISRFTGRAVKRDMT